MSYQRRLQGQAFGVDHCKGTGLASWMWEVVESEKRRHGSQQTLSMSSECVCVNHVGVETEKLILQLTSCYPFHVRSMHF